MSTIAERGRAHIFLGDSFLVYDNLAPPRPPYGEQS